MILYNYHLPVIKKSLLLELIEKRDRGRVEYFRAQR